ncbi:MAG: SIS domain-containing protein [Gammaproteobacteria bacterium]
MSTIMEQETREAPKVVAKQLQENLQVLQSLCAQVRHVQPKFAVTVARGSSDHACTYAKYLLETKLGLVTSSAAPSVITTYCADLQLADALVIGVSQSGKSPDICAMMEAARAKGAITATITNNPESPLAEAAEFVVPIWAGEEKAVAATKSYIGSLSAIAQFVALLSHDEKLLDCLHELPGCLTKALACDWSLILPELKEIERTFVIARGYGFGIAQEAALKLKETAVIQAEAFSSAEVLHGPFALVRRDRPFLLLTQNDRSLPGMIMLAKKIKNLHGVPFMAIPHNLVFDDELADVLSMALPLPESLHPVLDPLMAIQAFYPMVAQLAVLRGYNPDAPENLQKVTETR